MAPQSGKLDPSDIEATDLAEPLLQEGAKALA